MPRQYEAIRDKFAAKGMDYDQAQSHAAAIYNAAHPSMPMSAAHPEGAKRAKQAKRKALIGQMKGGC